MKISLFVLLTLAPLLSHARTVSIDRGGASFVAPNNFTPLSVREVAAYFPHAEGEVQAVGDPRHREAIIAYAINGAGVTPATQEAEKVETRATRNQVEILINDDYVTIEGVRWLYVDYLGYSNDRHLMRSIIFTTPYRGRELLVTAVMPAEAYKSYSLAMIGVMHSLRLYPRASHSWND